MAEKKEEKKMEEKVNPVVTQVMKQTQKGILNLDTGVEGEIELVYHKYVVNEAAPIKEVLEALAKIVHPDAKRAEALAVFATSQSYQIAKKEALAKGNFLTSQLKSTLTQIMQALVQFADAKGSECQERWMKGYKSPAGSKEKKAADILLERAKQALESNEFDVL